MPKKHMDLAGQTFTHKDRSFQVIDIHNTGVGGVHWNCLCKCGTVFVASGSQITRKTVTRCKNCRVPPGKPAERACLQCGTVFPFTTEFFVSSPQFRFGIRPVCKTCNNPKQSKYGSDRLKAMRLEILSHYSPGGSPHCLCCKESHFEFLAIDHTEGGSQDDYRKHANGAAYYRDIIRSGFPDRFRVLCHNCNMCAKVYGHCIHNPETILFHKAIRPKEGNHLIPVNSDFSGQTQVCIKCDRLFPVAIEFFSRHQAMASGFIRMCKDCQRNIQHIRSKPQMRERRLKILTHYSGGEPFCRCCNERHFEFLTIDHIHGGGNKQAKETGSRIDQWIIKNNFPEGFQILCYNCNLAKGFYGICPHR